MKSRAPQPGDRAAILRFGDCELHLLTREFWRAGARQSIPRRVFDLLLLLIEQRPRTVTHTDISKAVWGRAEVRTAQLAQTVMHARQLLGDVGDESRWILSVRGMGYRFAGAVAEGLPVEQAGVSSVPVDDLLATMAHAESARAAGDLERAQFLAERAVQLAQANEVNRQRATALSLAALVAITRGELEQAAGMAAKALQLAESEGLDDVAAEARLRVAHVRMLAGDLPGALLHVQASYSTLQASGASESRRRCERLIALVHREMGQYEQALHWCERSLSSAREAQDVLDARLSDSLMVDLTLLLADVLEERGQELEARAARERALAMNEALLPQAQESTNPGAMLTWLGNQAIALTHLDRCAQAWDVLDHMQRTLSEAPSTYGPRNPLWVSGLHRERARLLARTRRFVEAVAAIEQAIQAAEAGGLLTEMPPLFKVASRLCEQAGKLQDALAWLRRSHAASDALQVRRAASQAAILQAEAQADTLRRDLQDAVQQAQQLALENRVLHQRLQRLERGGRMNETDFANAGFLQGVVQPRHADARVRDVPLCMALLVVENLADLPSQDGGSYALSWLHELSRALTTVLGPAHEVVHWRPGMFVHVLEDQGERRARETCRRVETQLAAYPWPWGASAAAPAPRLRVVCVDAARYETLDEALTQLLQFTRTVAEADHSGT